MEIKKIMCFCGSGLGTSFIMEMNVKKVLDKLGRSDIEVKHSTIDDVMSGAADLFVCGTFIAQCFKGGKSNRIGQYGFNG